MANKQKNEWILEPETELRCEVNETDILILKLIEGNCEIFGIEMAANKEYSFIDENFAVYTWYGCKIESQMVVGSSTSVYKADSTPLVAYVNTHSQLEARRDIALANQDYGPRVLVVGDADNGKSTTVRTLASYAARLDRVPIVVDLDVGQNNISIPGTVSAVQIDKSSINIEEVFSHNMPLVYYFGHVTPNENIELYKLLVDILFSNIKERMNNDLDTKSSGIIVNTCGWVDGVGYDLILHIIKSFMIDVILVMNHDKLYSSLMNLINDGITVVKLPTSGGIVRRNAAFRRRTRKSTIKQYFYGHSHIPHLTFSPARLDIKLNNIKFLRAGGFLLSEGMRSMTDDTVPSSTELIVIPPTTDLLNSVIGVLQPIDNNDSNDINNSGKTMEISNELIKSNIAGFIVIVSINIDQNSMTILSPCPGMLPSKYLLVGSIKWTE
mmetsp:Transcript_11477/g.10406  ORF Transcript_11477/g.10406 Transcript_11477/m.10406 type:complete len:440 (+) Transcript_11477:13-1332(+)